MKKTVILAMEMNKEESNENLRNLLEIEQLFNTF